MGKRMDQSVPKTKEGRRWDSVGLSISGVCSKPAIMSWKPACRTFLGRAWRKGVAKNVIRQHRSRGLIDVSGRQGLTACDQRSSLRTWSNNASSVPKIDACTGFVHLAAWWVIRLKKLEKGRKPDPRDLGHLLNPISPR